MFYDKLKELCNKKGVKPSRVAIECGFSKGTVSHWKNSGTIPQRDILKKIANYFDVSVDYLLSNDEKETQVNDKALILTEHEKRLISAYRDKPEMQLAIDKLLGIDAVSRKNISEDIAETVINTQKTIHSKYNSLLK